MAKIKATQIADSQTLPTGTSATTQTAGTSNTTLATTAFVGTAITNLGVVKGLSSFISGKPTASQVVGGGASPYTFTIVSGNCLGIAKVAATASTVFSLQRNGTQIGTITFAASATAGSWSITDTAITAGQYISIHAPASADTTLADITFLVRN